MRSARPLPLLLAIAIAAGCLSAPAGELGTASVIVDEDRPEPAFNDIPDAALGTIAPPDLAATLLEPPQLREGEWWRIELMDTTTGVTTQFVRVVARVEDDLYVIGMPHEGWWKEAVVYHAPAFGDVNLDLSHRAHDVPFQPLVFPLVDGATWETAWEDPAPLTATVKVESPTTARITFTWTDCGLFYFFGACPNPGEDVLMELVYDATMHEVVEGNFYSHTWKVIEHGYGYEGWVTVPRGERLVFFHARMGAPVYDPWGARANAPSDTVLIEGGFNRVSFLMGAGNLLATDEGGAYSEKATAPDGTTYELAQVPGGSFELAFFEATDPDGEWTLEHFAAGPGLVYIEGIAYHQYDIHLPSGDIRTDHSHEVVR